MTWAKTATDGRGFMWLRRADAAGFDLGEHFGQRVLDDGDAEGDNFSETSPATSDQAFALGDVGWIELPLVKWTFDADRFEFVGHDVLSERWVAADVSLAGGVEHLGIEHADDVAKVQIAIGELGYILAADNAEIAFFALGHGGRL